MILKYTFTASSQGYELGITISYDIDTDTATALTLPGGSTPISIEGVVYPKVFSLNLFYSVYADGFYYYFSGKLIYPFVDVIKYAGPPPDPDYRVYIDSFVVTNETGPGLKDGTITVNAHGGVPSYLPLVYAIDNDSVWYTSNVITGLAPGFHSLYVCESGSSRLVATSTQFEVLPYVPIIPPEPPAPLEGDIIALAGAEIQMQNAYKRIIVNSKFGNVGTILYNGDFEAYDGQNWQFWIKYGGINVIRTERSIKNSNGIAVPLGNYAIKFMEQANPGRYLEHTAVPVQQGDTMKFSYRVGNTPGTGTTYYEFDYFNSPNKASISVFDDIYFLSKIRIKVGDYYLYNEDNGNNYQWVKQLAYVGNPVRNAQGDLNTCLVSFSIPEAPVSGQMVVQFFGFEKTFVRSAVNNEFNLALAGLFQKYTMPYYFGVEIDDVKVEKSSQNSDNDIDSIMNISTNPGYFTQKPDPIDILFGDYATRPGATEALDNLYAIKYAGQYTTGWSEYVGTSAAPVAFGLALAKSILTAYQKPFRFWAGSLKLREVAPNFSYLSVYNFEVLNKNNSNPRTSVFNNKIFVLLGGEVNLKTNQLNNAVLSEIFDKPINSQDSSFPAYPNMPIPDIPQDPNYVETTGIFTEEFTQEFK